MPYARKDTISWESGFYYHIYNRGAKSTNLFIEEDNYLYVQRQIRRNCIKYQLTMIAYCLMPNHYHFLIRQDDTYPAGKLSQYVFNGYTKAYNMRYGTSGTLFEGRYKCKIIDIPAYLFHLCRYIHANPVKAGLVNKPEEWPYSNYLDWIGRRNDMHVNQEFISEFYGSIDEYKAFLLDYLDSFALPEDLENYLSTIEN